MGILGRFFGKSKTIQDSEFGVMNLNAHFFEAEVTFEPTGEKCVLGFQESQDTPTQWQRQRYRELTERYLSIKGKLTESVLNSHVDFLGMSYSGDDIWDTTSLWDIRIHAEGDQENDILIAYSPDWCPDYIYNVVIKDWSITYAGLD